MLRIWPLYFAALLVGLLLAYRYHVLATYSHWFVAAVFFSGNMVHPAFPSLSHLWSISIEEQFYIFWPVAVRLCKRSQLLALAAFFIILANATLWHFGAIHAETDVRVWNNSFVQFEMFAMGILLALNENYRKRISATLGWSLLAILSLPVAWLAAAYLGLKGHPVLARGPINLCVGYGLVAVACALLISGFSHFQKWPRPVLYFGKISYGLYVFHMFFLNHFGQFGVFRLNVPDSGRKVAAVVATFCCAPLSYKFFEKPFLRLKERFEVIRTRAA